MALPAGQGLLPVTDSLREEGGWRGAMGWVPFPIWLLERCALTHLHLRRPSALTYLCALPNGSQ